MVAFTKQKIVTPAVLGKLSAKACTRAADSQLPPNCIDADHSSDDDGEDEEEQHGHLIITTTRASCAHPSLNTHSSPCSKPYSLTFGPLSTHKRHPPISPSSSRKRSYPPTRAAPSPSSSSPRTSTSAYHTSPQEEISSIRPSDHMKTLLTQLASRIMALKAATWLGGLATGVCHCADETYSKARQFMEKELRALSDVHLRLYALVQEQNFGQSYETPSIDHSTGPNSQNSPERQEMMLRAYEGVIVRFHDEMRKKDAVAEALKETLARSMLKGEKLERRVKALEAYNKLPSVQPKPK